MPWFHCVLDQSLTMQVTIWNLCGPQSFIICILLHLPLLFKWGKGSWHNSLPKAFYKNYHYKQGREFYCKELGSFTVSRIRVCSYLEPYFSPHRNISIWPAWENVCCEIYYLTVYFINMVGVKNLRKACISIWEDFKIPCSMPLEIGSLVLWPQTMISVSQIILFKLQSPISTPSGWGIPSIYSVTFVLMRSVLLAFPKLKPLCFSCRVSSPSLSKGCFIFEFCSLAFLLTAF